MGSDEQQLPGWRICEVGGSDGSSVTPLRSHWFARAAARKLGVSRLQLARFGAAGADCGAEVSGDSACGDITAAETRTADARRLAADAT